MSRHTNGPSSGKKRFTIAVNGRLRRRLALVIVLALVAVAPAAPAVSAEDTEPIPELEASLEFVLGEPVQQGTADAFPGPAYAGAPVQLRASFRGLEAAYVGEGSVNADWLVRQDHFGAPSGVLALGEVVVGDVEITMSLQRVINDYDGDLGGGSGRKHSWYIGATDYRHGVHTEVTVGARLQVFQEDGTDLTLERPDANITMKGAWRESFCDCWLGGKVLRTSRKWARLTYSFEADEGQVVAIVMPMAPNRGKARIKLDGVRQARVDTYSPTRDNRIIVWQTEPLEAGMHRIDVINLGTSGRPRIDIDAFVQTEGFVDPVWHLE